jgi:predicted nucleic acid-binding protein
MAADAVVVDASALAALLFGEPTGPEVAARLGERRLFAPTLVRYELASVCLKKARREPDKETSLRMALDLFSALRVREVQVPAEGIVELARATELTVYDAAYLWLARHLEVQLVTLDARLKAALLPER